MPECILSMCVGLCLHRCRSTCVLAKETPERLNAFGGQMLGSRVISGSSLSWKPTQLQGSEANCPRNSSRVQEFLQLHQRKLIVKSIVVSLPERVNRGTYHCIVTSERWQDTKMAGEWMRIDDHRLTVVCTLIRIRIK